MLKALILIGGESSRMGKEKYLLEFNGKPQYVYLAGLLKNLNLPVYISCNKHQIKEIPDDYNKIKDLYEGIGPMGGIISAFQSDTHSDWLVLACDLILLDNEAISKLIENNHSSFEIITFQKKGFDKPETTASIYRNNTYSRFKDALENTSFSLQNILRNCKVKTITPLENTKLWNANTQEELEEAKKFKNL